jgi:glutathione S-transferase
MAGAASSQVRLMNSSSFCSRTLLTGEIQFTLYTSDASQWAYVAHLTIDEKGYEPSEYIVKQIGLGKQPHKITDLIPNTGLVVDGENFAPEYVQINPNGTIPSLTSSSLPEPLVDSKDILRYLDSNHPKGPSLFPADPKQRHKIEELIAHVHQPKLSTNLILLQARDAQELGAKKASFWKDFVRNRQRKLIKYGATHPNIPLYLLRTPENGKLYHIYNASEIGPKHDQFFADSRQGYKDFAAGLNELDSMIVLPYAAGDKVTAADLHIVPWLAHALWGAGGKTIEEFEPLKELIKQSVPGFEFGDNTMTWWRNISGTDSFQKNYPSLH